MSTMTGELERVGALHRDGTLTDAEFGAAKAAVLSLHAGTAQGDLDQIRLQVDVQQLDRDWEIEREAHRVTGFDGHQYYPTHRHGDLALATWVFLGLMFILSGFKAQALSRDFETAMAETRSRGLAMPDPPTMVLDRDGRWVPVDAGADDGILDGLAPGTMALITGVLFIGAGAALSARHYRRSNHYEAARDTYLARRAKLMEVKHERSGSPAKA